MTTAAMRQKAMESLTLRREALPNWLAPTLNDSYAKTATVHAVGDWQPVRGEILRVRDLQERPLTLEQFIANPLRERSRYVLTFFDENDYTEKHVYYRLLFKKFFRSPLRVGLFRGSKLIETLEPVWGSTERERMHLAAFAKALMGQNFGDLRPGIFAEDRANLPGASY